MTQIQHISTSTIRPISTDTDELAHRRIELTPWDLRMINLGYHQKGLLFHKSADEEVNHGLIQHLKASLSSTLDIFYPLAGRLAVTEVEDKVTCISIDCNGSGAQFVHAASDCVTVADLLNPACIPDGIIYNLFSLNSVVNYEGISNPLLAVQVTQLVDGIFIGCSANHAAIDGTSFWHFFNTWSEISRIGSDHISQIPRPVCATGLPIRLPFSYSEIIKGKNRTEPSTDDSLQRVVFHFSKEKISELKAKANAEMGTNNVISSLQALMAHLWRAIIRSKHDLNPDEQTTYMVVVGLRRRLKPPLPKEYLGNALLGVMVKSTAGELLQQGLGWVAMRINRRIASMTAGEVSRYLEEWMTSPVLVPKITTSSSSLNLLIGSSPRFNVYGNDFGWGRPVAVRSGTAAKQNGNLTVFPGAEEGSIDFEACLLRETLQAMKEDAEFMEALFTS
ncbi:hypothetical protein ACLB2K_003694 [Fragaria x ananassa]